MFDVGFQEMLLIMVLALIVFGPSKLPELGKMIGRAMREFRRASDEFRSTVETNLNLHDVDIPSTSSPAQADSSRRSPLCVIGAGRDGARAPRRAEGAQAAPEAGGVATEQAARARGTGLSGGRACFTAATASGRRGSPRRSGSRSRRSPRRGRRATRPVPCASRWRWGSPSEPGVELFFAHYDQQMSASLMASLNRSRGRRRRDDMRELTARQRES